MNTDEEKGPCPGYHLHVSQDRWDEGKSYRQKVDAAIRPANSVPQDGQSHWEKQSALVEFKPANIQVDAYDYISGSYSTT